MSRKEDFGFSADQIGSEVLARFSEDIYSPRAILRELNKNASDSYFQLAHRFPDAGYDTAEREVKVDVAGNSVIIKDEGLGMAVPDLKELISIALTEKREIDGVTGFRGIGFWSAYTGGDTIVVETTRLGHDRLYKLTLNTSRMRQLEGPEVSIGKIMNDPKCMELVSDPAPKDEHYTKVLVRAETAKGRLHELIHNPDLLKKVLLTSCSCRIAEKSRHAKQIAEFYDRYNVEPVRLIFQGHELFREIPSEAGDFIEKTLELEIGKKRQIVARIWFSTNTNNARFESPFAGMRVLWGSFPIGQSNLYSHGSYDDNEIEVTRPDLLDWHVGEIHLLNDSLRPNAAGEEIRDSILLSAFRNSLRSFYETELVPISRSKQRKVSLKKEYDGYLNKLNVLEDKIESNGKLQTEEVAQIQAIAKTIDRHNSQARGRVKQDAGLASQAIIVRDSEIKVKRKQISGLLATLQKKAKLPSGKTSGNERKRRVSNKKGSLALGKNGTDVISKDLALALIDEIRDAVVEVLSDDPTLRDELLDKINRIVSGAAI